MSLLKYANSIFSTTPSDKSAIPGGQWPKYLAASAVGISVIGVLFTALNKYRAKKHDNVPLFAEKDWSFFTGHLNKMLECNEDGINHFHEWLYQGLKQMDFPPISCATIPKQKWIFLSDPELIKFTLQTNASLFQRLRDVEEFEPMLGNGIFSANGKQWKFHRKVASRMFSMRNLKNYMFNMSVKHTMEMMQKLKQLSLQNAAIDINELLGRFTLDTFCEIAFGVNINAVQTYPHLHQFGVAFDETLVCIDKRTIDAFWKLKRIVGAQNEQIIAKNAKILDEFVNNILDAKLGKKSAGNGSFMDESGGGSYDILSLFLKHNENLSRKELRDIAMNFIIAGRDTTRMLLSWFLYEISLDKNKQIKRKLIEEINGYQTEPTYSDFLSGFRYLEGALCETLRLWPSVPFIGRDCVKDLELPIKDENGRPYIIRKGDFLLASNYSNGRNPKIWGEDVMQFKPERWAEKGVNTFDQYEFGAFNVNPRLCLGKQFALTEAKVFAYYFFKNFDFERDESKPVTIKQGAVLNMESGLVINVVQKDSI